MGRFKIVLIILNGASRPFICQVSGILIQDIGVLILGARTPPNYYATVENETGLLEGDFL